MHGVSMSALSLSQPVGVVSSSGVLARQLVRERKKCARSARVMLGSGSRGSVPDGVVDCSACGVQVACATATWLGESTHTQPQVRAVLWLERIALLMALEKLPKIRSGSSYPLLLLGLATRPRCLRVQVVAMCPHASRKGASVNPRALSTASSCPSLVSIQRVGENRRVGALALERLARLRQQPERQHIALLRHRSTHLHQRRAPPPWCAASSGSDDCAA